MIRFTAALATVALLIVGSLAWAADPPAKKERIGRGSVTSQAIKDNTVRMRDLSAPLRRMLRGRPAGENEDFGDDSGGQGLDGLDGADGLDGEDGVSGYEAVTADTAPEQVGEAAKTREVECPAGKVVTGGGVMPQPAPGSDAVVVVTLTAAQDDSTGWRGSAQRVEGSGPWTLRVQALCAAVEP